VGTALVCLVAVAIALIANARAPVTGNPMPAIGENMTAAPASGAADTANQEAVFAGVTDAPVPNAVKREIKVGVILVNNENSTYDMAHIDGIQKGAQAAGLTEDRIVWRYNIPEDETCYDTAVDLVEQGCNYVIADSYGYQNYMLQAAEQYPDVTFIAITGDNAALSGLPNLKNAFPRAFESRYVSGVVAGMKLQQLLDDGAINEPYIGFIGGFAYSEVISAYTAFFLGVQSVVPSAYMEVVYTYSWSNPIAEGKIADALIDNDVHIISQYSDTTDTPVRVQTALNAGKQVYFIGSGIDVLDAAPTAVLTSVQNDWSVYYAYVFKTALAGGDIITDWSEGYAAGAVMLSKLGQSCAPGTAMKVAEVETALIDGTLNVFDTERFSVGGMLVTTYKAIDTNGDWEGDKGEAIVNGIFYESKLRSAPYFDLHIDGITELD
jgi:basic membrane protein A